MKLVRVVLVVGLAAGPFAARADEGTTSLPRAAEPLGTASLVLTPQGVRRQSPAPVRGDRGPPRSDLQRQALWPARPTLLDLATSIACTSMFALPPDTLGTDPAASAGR